MQRHSLHRRARGPGYSSGLHSARPPSATREHQPQLHPRTKKRLAQLWHHYRNWQQRFAQLSDTSKLCSWPALRSSERLHHWARSPRKKERPTPRRRHAAGTTAAALGFPSEAGTPPCGPPAASTGPAPARDPSPGAIPVSALPEDCSSLPRAAATVPGQLRSLQRGRWTWLLRARRGKLVNSPKPRAAMVRGARARTKGRWASAHARGGGGKGWEAMGSLEGQTRRRTLAYTRKRVAAWMRLSHVSDFPSPTVL